MSLRQLKKLENQKLEGSKTPETEQEGDSPDENPLIAQTKTFNAFSFLEEENDEDRNSQHSEPEVEAVSTVPKSSKKNRKKKKKSKSSVPNSNKEDSDSELDKLLAEAVANDMKKLGIKQQSNQEIDPPSDDGEDFEDEYNEALEPEVDYDSNYKNFTTERLKQSIPLLSINSVKNLDSDEELKSLFGELSLETIEDANNTTSLSISPDVLKQFKRLARLTKGWGGKDKRSVPGTTRKLLLTRIKDDYLPTQQKPLSMDELSEKEVFELLDYKENLVEPSDIEKKIRKEKKLGIKYFRFKKNLTVQERVASTQFYASVVISPDHDSLFALLRNCPYHVETLLQVSKVLLRQGSDKSTSNALIEKCMFVFDRCFHKYFHDLLLQGQNGLLRLPYECFMNRQFYICLFRYIANLGERSTFFTSLLFCKFLLSLSPAEDPLGVRYFIDHYAIKSGEYKYLINLVQSPLITAYHRWFTPGIAFSTVLAHLLLGDQEGAKTLLRLAFNAHPFTAMSLLKEVCLSSVNSIKESDIFVNEEILLTNETYMVRAKALWDSADHIRFLNDELHELFNHQFTKLETNTGLVASVQNFFFPNKPDFKTSKEIPFNLLRFAILSEENKIMAKVPESIWSRDDVFEFDPLPPKNSTIGYDAISGINNDNKLVDSALDYVDQNLLAAIIQNRTQDDSFEEIVRQLQVEE